MDTILLEKRDQFVLERYALYRLAGTKIDPNLPADAEYPPIGVELNASAERSVQTTDPVRYRLIRLTHRAKA